MVFDCFQSDYQIQSSFLFETIFYRISWSEFMPDTMFYRDVWNLLQCTYEYNKNHGTVRVYQNIMKIKTRRTFGISVNIRNDVNLSY